jgi:hypothetical protein
MDFTVLRVYGFYKICISNMLNEIITSMYIFDWKSNEMHTDFLCILYFTIFALHVLGAIYTHHQEHKLQSTAVRMRDCYGMWEVG